MAKIVNNKVNLSFSNNDKDNDNLIIINNQTSFIDQGTNFFTKEGNAAHYDFRYNEAISYYDKALALEPNNTNTLYGKANALSNLNRYELEQKHVLCHSR